MNRSLSSRQFAITTGISYWIIFFAAVFANFFVLEAISKNPLQTVQQDQLLIRAGILAFLITVVFDVIVAWSLYELYKDHVLSGLSSLFRMMHAAIMGVAVFSLPMVFGLNDSQQILKQIDVFNTIWLIGLFFFGVHLILLGKIIVKPKVIAIFLFIAGIMYMIDTAAHFMLANYQDYSSIFFAFVAIPSILGEMSFAVWLLLKGGNNDYSFGRKGWI